MYENIGRIDRLLRLLIGLTLLAMRVLGMVGLWGWMGLIPMATALFKFCPAYMLLGIKTCKVEPELH